MYYLNCDKKNYYFRKKMNNCDTQLFNFFPLKLTLLENYVSN